MVAKLQTQTFNHFKYTKFVWVSKVAKLQNQNFNI